MRASSWTRLYFDWHLNRNDNDDGVDDDGLGSSIRSKPRLSASSIFIDLDNLQLAKMANGTEQRQTMFEQMQLLQSTIATLQNHTPGS